VLLASTLVLCFFQVTDVDVGGHLTVGREILKTGKIPNRDFFTHTVRGNPYPVHQWLGEVTMFIVEYVAGANGLILMRMAVVLAGTLLLYRLLRREGAAVVVTCGILLLLLVAMRPRFFERPFLATLVFLPLLMTWIADVREGRTRRLWPILPLMTIWAHVHSGVVFGMLYLLGTLAGEGLKILVAGKNQEPGRSQFFADPLDGWNYRRLAMFSALAIALPYVTMAIVNPSGVKPLLLPFLFVSNSNFMAMIQEYRRVDLHIDWPFDLVAGAVVFGCLLRPRRVDVTDLLLATGFGIMAYLAVREILSFGIVAAPLLGRTWGRLAEDVFVAISPHEKRGHQETMQGYARANAVEAVVIVIVAAACLTASIKATRSWIFPFGPGKDARHYPDRAIDFLLAQNIRGPLFNTDLFASSLLWRDHGKRFPVFVDARLEAYPENFWRDVYYRVLQAAPGWEQVLDRYQVQFAMLRRQSGETDDLIGTALWDDPKWGVVYWDDYALLYVRRESAAQRNREALAAWEFTSFDPRHPDRIQELTGPALERSVEEIQRLVEWNPDSFLLQWTLAAGWSGSGRSEEALAAFQRLRRRAEARDNKPFLVSYADAMLLAGKRTEWEKLIGESGANPRQVDELFRAGTILSRAGARSVAIAFYREALAADSTHADSMNNLALLLAADPGSIDEALRLLDNAIRRHPEDGYYWSSRGDVRRSAGREEEAQEDYRRALSLLPEEDAAARAVVEAALHADSSGTETRLPLAPKQE
jgi:tetratricopeptide (TPR) repeat protein